MDIKERLEKMLERMKKDDDLKERFMKDPVKAVEKVLGVDLPDDLVEKIIAAVKAEIAGDGLAGALGSLKKLF